MRDGRSLTPFVMFDALLEGESIQAVIEIKIETMP
jgi:hypothetical protein